MSTSRNLELALALLPGLWATQLDADVIVTSAQEPWEGCGYCHGIDGISAVATFPHLAGQDAAYLRKQLQDFSAGRRQNDNGVMTTQAEALDDASIAVLARYFAGETPPARQATVENNAESRAARTLYETGDPERDLPACSSCHGGQTAGVPRLSSQHAGYLRKQLEDFAQGHRNNAPGQGMARIAAALTEVERAALSHFMAGMDVPTAGRAPAAETDKWGCYDLLYGPESLHQPQQN